MHWWCREGSITLTIYDIPNRKYLTPLSKISIESSTWLLRDIETIKYWWLNAMALEDVHSLSWIIASVDVSWRKLFITLDVMTAYWQVPFSPGILATDASCNDFSLQVGSTVVVNFKSLWLCVHLTEQVLIKAKITKTVSSYLPKQFIFPFVSRCPITFTVREHNFSIKIKNGD